MSYDFKTNNFLFFKPEAMAPHAQSKRHARAASMHITTVPDKLGIPKRLYFSQATKRKSISQIKRKILHLYIFLQVKRPRKS